MRSCQCGQRPPLPSEVWCCARGCTHRYAANVPHLQSTPTAASSPHTNTDTGQHPQLSTVDLLLCCIHARAQAPDVTESAPSSASTTRPAADAAVVDEDGQGTPNLPSFTLAALAEFDGRNGKAIYMASAPFTPSHHTVWWWCSAPLHSVPHRVAKRTHAPTYVA